MGTGEKPTGSIEPLWKIKLQDLRSDVEKKIPDGIDDAEKETIIKSTRDILTDMKKDLGADTASPYYTQLKDLLETVKKHRTQKPTPTTEPIESSSGVNSPEKTVIRNSIGTELLTSTIDMLKIMRPNAKIAYERMVGRAQKQQCNFIVADKNKGSLYLFNQFGQSIVRLNALYGKQKGDEIPKSAWIKDIDELSDNEKVTPAGIYVLSSMYNNKYLNSKALDVMEDYDDDGEADDEGDIALHPVYLGIPGENRLDRLNSNTPKDNNISYGCINVLNADFDEWIYTCFGGSGGLIAIVPNNSKSLDKYIPPYTADTPRVATSNK